MVTVRCFPEEPSDPSPAVTVFGSFREAEPAWRRFEADGLHYAFQTYDWLVQWHLDIGKRKGLAPCLVSVEDMRAGRLLFLPLAIERRLGARCLVWLGGRQSDYHAPLLGAGHAALQRSIDFTALWRHILARLPRIDVVHLQKQPPDIVGAPNPFLALGAAPSGVSAHATRLLPDWPEYYSSKRSARTRGSDRRKLRRLHDRGAVRFRVTADPGAIEDTLGRLAEFKGQQARRAGGSDLFREAGCRDFYGALAAGSHQHLRVLLSTLELDGRIIAAHWGLLAGRRFHWLVPAYDEAEAAHSPGLYLMRLLMEWCCANGIEVFDFGLGDERYKTGWSDCDQPLYDYLEWMSWRGAGQAGAVLIHRRLRGLLRRLPLLADAKRAIQRAAARVR